MYLKSQQYSRLYLLRYTNFVHLIVFKFMPPWSRVLPGKLRFSKLIKKFPVFYGAKKFITVYTRARHLSLS